MRAPSPPQDEHADAERRHLTVLFCDLVGSTALSEQFDPEEMRELLTRYQSACAGVVSRYNGFIARYVGDGVLVYFGYPRAHEDDAQSAVRAGLGIVDTIGKLATEYAPSGVKLEVRIGIATGLVVVGDIGSGDLREQKAIVGETPNLAARLHGAAAPNTVVIAKSTHRLVEGLFECDDLGPQQLKGLSGAVSAFRVRGESEAPSRFEAAAQRGLTAMIGREEEVAFIMKRWAQAKDGEGQVLLLEGEAGIGKSRLLRSIRERIEDEPHYRILYYGSQYHQNSAFHPVIDQLRRGLRFGRDDSAQDRLGKLKAVLAGFGLDVPSYAPLIAGFLSLRVEGGHPADELSPEQRKKKTLEALAGMMKAMARQRPVLMVVEDMRWVDPSTIELLTVLVEHLRASRFLLVATFRPGFTPPWNAGGRVSSFTLSRLSRRECAAMVADVARGLPLPEDVLAEIIVKTDGVPLFVEELTKMILESDLLEEAGDRYRLSGTLVAPAIPASLHDLLMARLDRLALVKDLAQLAAALGRTFSHELLAAVSPLDKEKLESALDQLIRAELLYRHGLPPEVTYEFKHALVRDAAYQSLLKSTRCQYHQRIARVMEERFPEIVDSQPELLAHHYAEARIPQRAVEFWRKAGQRAVERSANLEAIEHMRKGLELLKALPDTPERSQQELELQITLAVPLTATSGYAAAEVAQVYARARELCQQIGDAAQLFPALYGLWRYYLLRAEYATARELGEQLLSLAEGAREPVFLVAAHRALGATLFYCGELIESQAHLDSALSLHPALADAGTLIARTYDVADPEVASRSYGSWVLWLLGHSERAMALSAEALALAHQRAHPFSIALALSFAAWLHQFNRDPEQTRRQAEAALAIATERGFPFWVGWDSILGGWAVARAAPEEPVAARIRQGLDSWRAQGSELGRSYFLTLLAEVHAGKGEIDEGLAALEEARTFTDRTGERFWQAEQCRLRGELLLRRGAAFANEGRACLQEALEIARRQQARSLELRAAISLSRLWRRERRTAEARALLADSCGWFKEGLHAADFAEARSLMQELAA